MIYCDSAYLLKFYVPEPGSEQVRGLFENEDVASCCHAGIEVTSAIHRKWREGLIPEESFRLTARQFHQDIETGCWTWFAITPELLEQVRTTYERVPAECFLRAADALHLACARDHGFKIVYSNDKTLLTAAKHFGISGENVIG